MATDALPALTLYTRSGCHLCDDMMAGLRSLQASHGFAVTLIDVDHDPALEERYGKRVPVLVGGGRELCQHFLEPAAVTAFLSEIR
jgi:glutaredoxin